MTDRERKTAEELEAMISAELNEPRIKVSVSPNQNSGWQATTSAWGTMNAGALMRAQQIIERLRERYDLKRDWFPNPFAEN